MTVYLELASFTELHMSQQRGRRALSRGIIKVGVPLLLMIGLAALASSNKPATEGEATLSGLAVNHKGVIAISAVVTNLEDGKLNGTFRAELVDRLGTVIDSKKQTIKQADRMGAYRFDLHSKQNPLDSLKLRLVFGKNKVETPLKDVLLVKGHETALWVGTQFHPGTTTSLRCSVQGVRSLTETVPLPAASVEVKLKDAEGKATLLFSGRTDDEGAVAAQLKFPALPAGDYTLHVVTRSPLGQDKLEQKVKIKAEPRVLLVTDRPLYQPGQVIHMRALCLGAFDLKPVAKGAIVFEVEDGKGNKVFKREQKTSAHGIAAIDFQLASEVNQGEYHVRAILGERTAEKTVTVKPYLLPKFKAELTADRKFYLPRQTINADLQVDYFFGKPVAGGKVKVTASTFDVEFKDFQTIDTKTDEQGHAKIEVKLPDYFVGQPLAQGNALIKLEVKVIDRADHTETITRTYPVSDRPINVTLIPEGGRLVPDVENRVFAAAMTPDGSPVECEVQLWHTRNVRNKFIGKARTGANGLAEFRFTPEAGMFRVPDQEQRFLAMFPGVGDGQALRKSLDVKVITREDRGTKVESKVALTSDPVGENLLLRLDRAIYLSGDTLKIDVFTSAAVPTVYLDVIKEGQVLLTRSCEVKDSKASHRLDLPPEVFGTLEIHAYQVSSSGIVRDARVVYVQPASELKIAVKPDRDVHLPGQPGTIRFEVTDADDKPAAAVLGMIVVDEAVYALQDMQPGLEKVFFTLQQEFLRPQAQVIHNPKESLDRLVLRGEMNAERQQTAQVLMSAIRPRPPENWRIDPTAARKEKTESDVNSIGDALFADWVLSNKSAIVRDPATNVWKFRNESLNRLIKNQMVDKSVKSDALGRQQRISDLTNIDPTFTPDRLARAVTMYRMQGLFLAMIDYSNFNKPELMKNDKWVFPQTFLEDVLQSQDAKPFGLLDAWGNKFRLVKVKTKRNNPTPFSQFDHHHLVSAGPDGKFGTDDDVTIDVRVDWKFDRTALFLRQAQRNPFGAFGAGLGALGALGAGGALGGVLGGGAAGFGGALGAGGGGLGGLGGFPGGLRLPERNEAQPRTPGAVPAIRVRESFPETMLWQPLLITDDKGIATLNLQFADSITTWRLTASASSINGHLGSATAPLRVFQDFFVDLDLPTALTMNDEVSFPVAVYNYLKTPQTVKLELIQEPWFELVDGGALRSIELKPGEVTSVKFRIRAKQIGNFPLTVKASGSKVSDAIKRSVEVVPDGQRREQVVNQRLAGKSTHTLTIPANAISDSSKLMVKVYPGIFSQVLEGAEGILRMPSGCFEQTTSSAYPNVLVVDYIKKMHLANPAIQLKAENLLNVGYQRLLTFERPGGGFDLFGNSEPVVWLSAYGLQEFTDMAKVYPIDRAVIERTQKWLMKQMAPDGTWSMTHHHLIEHTGNPKFVPTCYVVWALCDSGFKGKELQKSIDFIRNEISKATSPYVLALAANALAAWDPAHDSTLDAMRSLLKMKKQPKEAQVLFFKAAGQSLTYSSNDSLTVETTALAALAMLRTKQFSADANKALMYLVKSKDAYGTWGSTQATILALKALVMSAGASPQEEKARFTISIGGKAVADGEINEKNSDVLQLFDLKEHVKTGENEVAVEVKGETNMMFQIVSRHFEPWGAKEQKKPVLELAVEYDRTNLSTADVLKAKATLKYNGETSTSQVIVDLGIPPGFLVNRDDFAAVAAANRAQRIESTGRQVILYLGDVKPGEVLTFEYRLKPKYPLKARTPSTVAYEYYTPANRAEAKPTELTVTDGK
jgi:uncharacterized protein YfaS (alpha-2-macroglobulin family)